MLHNLFDDEPWFEPKRFGYGAGRPIVWQGWVVYLSFIALILGLTSFAQARPDFVAPLAIPLLGIAIVLLVVISRRHTKGGWRWRWGE